MRPEYADRLGRAVLLLAVASLIVCRGCAGEPAPHYVPRPNVFDKLDFAPATYRALLGSGLPPESVPSAAFASEPIFYTQTTAIEGPTSGGFTGLTRHTTMDRIRWEIREFFLVARRASAFDTSPGAPPIGSRPLDSDDVIAVYRIQSHLALRAEYVESTGSYRYVDDPVDAARPWYQRRYMEVDWAQNLIDHYELSLGLVSSSARVQSEPVPLYINNPLDPRATVVQYGKHGTSVRLDYFDVVNRMVLHPERSSLSSDSGSFTETPVCDFTESPTCMPTELTVRVAFLRLDPQRDYEPALLENSPPVPPGATERRLDQRRFGFFDPNRIGADHDGPQDLRTSTAHWAARHNLWQWHHALFERSETPPPTGTPCNDDSACVDGTACHILSTPHDASHRGLCQPLAIHHLLVTPVVPGGASGTDIACQTDDDCQSAATAVSPTALCDLSTHTCGERFVRCMLDEECSRGVDPHSYCDVGIAYSRRDNRGLCTMPFRQRVVRQIAYHETRNYPHSMERVTQQTVREWNDAFANAVQMARVRECRRDRLRSGQPGRGQLDPCDSPQVRGIDAAFAGTVNGGQPDGRFPLVGCHSPVIGTDAEAVSAGFQGVQDLHDHGWDLPVCGRPGDTARVGDLRYHQIAGQLDASPQGYWGTAAIGSDPETGEMIVGRASVWQTFTDLYATRIVSLVRILNHEEETGEERAQAPSVLATAEQLATGETPAAGVLDHTRLERNSALGRLRLPDAGWFFRDPQSTLLGTAAGTNSALRVARQRVLHAGLLGDGRDTGGARIAALAGGLIESVVLQNAMQASIVRPGISLPEAEQRRRTSPFQGQSVAQRRVREQVERAASAWECNYEPAFSDDMLLGLAQRLARTDQIVRGTPEDDANTFGRDWNFRQPDGTRDYAALTEYAANVVHHGVLAHELGHSLGLRHNFEASADAVNYFDNYWRHRGEGHHLGLATRVEYLWDPLDGHYHSPPELEAHIEEWSYSSVMDHRGLNDAAHGIGRYDRAFVANAYARLLEAFGGTQNDDLALQYSVATSGTGTSMPLDMTGRLSRYVRAMHYTQMPAIFGAMADGRPAIGDENRYWVFADETTTQPVDGWGEPSFSNVTSDGHILVPYRQDSDEHEGEVWHNQAFDEGADCHESLRSVQERYLNGYFTNSFGRGDPGFLPSEYVRRTWAHYLRNIHQTSQRIAFDMVIFGDVFGSEWDSLLSETRGGLVERAALAMSADTLISTVTMPEMGMHAAATEPDGQTLVAPTLMDPAGFDVPIGQGRAYESAWGDARPGFSPQLDRAGSYFDKTLSLQALADPELSIDEVGWGRTQYQVSTYVVFPAQTIRFFGGLLSGDYADFAPIVDTAAPHIIRRIWFSVLTVPSPVSGRVIDASHVPIDPQAHFTMQLWSAILTLAEFPTAGDTRYLEYARIWIDGQPEALNLPDPASSTVSFTDPWTHEVYRARHVGARPGEPGEDIGASSLVHPSTGTSASEAGIGARMLLHASDLDYMRLHGTTPQADAALRALQTYLDVLRVVRHMSSCTRFGGTQPTCPGG